MHNRTNLLKLSVRIPEDGMSQNTAIKNDLRNEAIPHLGVLLQTANWFTQNKKDAEKLVMEAYVKTSQLCGRSWSKADFKISVFKALSKMILANIKPNFHTHICEELQDPKNSIPFSEASSISTIPKDVLIGTIKSLPMEIRLTIVLSIYGKLNYPEIAAIIGIHRSVVSLKIFQAYALIRKALFDHVAAGKQA